MFWSTNTSTNETNTMKNSEFDNWCKSEVKKLTGSTDTSLLLSCLNMESSAKIREFIRDLYGSKPEVSNFATEFIRRKEKSLNQKKKGKK